MKPKSNYISPDQFEDIINYVPHLRIRKWLDTDVQFAYKIAYYCGLRMGEIPALVKEDFDFIRHEVYIKDGKVDTRYAVIPLFFEPELRRYLDNKKPLEPILKDCDVQNIYLWLMKTGEALNIEALTTPQSITHEKTKLHGFRKSIGKDIVYGTFGKKGNIYDVQSILGHKNPVTTGRYLRMDNETGKDFWSKPRED